MPPSCCGAGYFRRLRRALPEEIDVLALELPGHGRRYAEPYLTSASAVVADALARIEGPVDIIYGESLGAYVGLALVAALSEGRRPALVAASNVPPARQREVSAADVATSQAAVATFTSMGGAIASEVLTDPHLAAGAFPMIRSDLLLSRSFVECVRTTSVPGNVTVLAGDRDNSLSGLHTWAAHTTGRCSVEVLPGDHLLAGSNPSGVADALLSVLSEV
ncbi:thioesterase II family protein [Streptomyces sp. NBC_00859]|uniref:thioesterase II family protein n=1 Tax=Streptomyces sp. NBC_00859 TaxID=2903682 RepID=UPI0038638209|nr:alpha/beta fold hydrolase [Streptomyces sp. NBC_00859]